VTFLFFMKTIIVLALSLFSSASLLLTPTVAYAAPGDLDTNFAGTGELMTSFGFGNDIGQAVAVQSDGKLVIAGYSDSGPTGGTIEIVRFNTSYQLDSSFGVNGEVVETGYSNAIVSTLALQSDGGMVVAGNSMTNGYSCFTLWRYTTNGTVDTSFGTNGAVVTDFGQSSVINRAAVQPDGKIIAVGTVTVGGNSDFAIVRYNTNGALDTSFGSGGKVTAVAGGDAGGYGVALPGDGTILVSGTGGFKFALLSFTTNGAVNTAFGGGSGMAVTNPGASGSLSTAYAVTIQPSGIMVGQNAQIVAAGITDPTSGHIAMVVARYNLDGSFDTTFGTNGTIVKSFNPGLGGGDYANSVIATRSGISGAVIKIIVGGYGTTPTNTFFELMKLTTTGALDTTFNGTGLRTLQFGRGFYDQPAALVFQSGNYVLAGSSLVNNNNSDFAAARFNNSDGSLDTNFNGTGILTADIASTSSTGQGVTKQTDGKYVAVGYADNGVNNDLAVARYNPDGSLDSSFGAGGKVTTEITNQSVGGAAVTMQTDGKILVAGNAYNGTNYFFALARYNSNGALDPSFGTNGTLLTQVGNSNSSATAVTVQTDGKILASGSSYNGANDDFATVRYLTNGTLDTTFNSTGKVTTAIASGEDDSQAIVVQPDGKIIVSGYGTVNSSIEFAAVRYLTNGALDTSFGSLGRLATSLPGQAAAEGLCMVLQTNNRIVIGGVFANSSVIEFAAARYLTNGSFDTSFNGTGSAVFQVGLASDFAYGAALQTDGKILLAGSSQTGQYKEFAAARLNADGTLDSSYGIGGRVVQTFNTGADEVPSGVVLDSNNGALLVGTAGDQFALMKLQGNPILKILSISHLGNGHNLLTGIGVVNGSHTLLATPTLKSNFTTLGPVSADGSGAWQYEDASLIGVTNRFYRLSYP
jgi:uncharacterized delta-60 repeat protein